MKVFLIFLSLVMISLSQSDRKLIKVRVDGLSCPFCAYGLEKKFQELEQIADFKIDIENGLVTFTLPNDKEIDKDQLSAIVKDAGFTAKEISISKDV